eukprot:TRINITY_DN9021_c0_g1::TRINITY_DN9021_c0_g1_i1::g.18223::m.18223 TRINITY_DN9021_c0_g1::TRINITY_DN9021_c0_g1_i1::g.18223  ORF type:complete len:132 (-),score=51.19,sp/O74503/UAF30_SCHPO/33.33/9e-19,SWIB/PF02201.13/1.5e-26 TRINITY_DN9021_c0_g1_i1:81-476(-)
MAKAKKPRKKRTGGGGGGGLAKPVRIKTDLKDVVEGDVMARTDIIKNLWKYIKANDLQNPDNKREILCDEKFKSVFARDKMNMFEMNKLLNDHIEPASEAEIADYKKNHKVDEPEPEASAEEKEASGGESD